MASNPSSAKWNILGTNDASFNDGTGIANLSLSTTALSNPYKFAVYKSAVQTSVNTSVQKVVFQSELFDTNNDFDSSTNYRYTAPVDGFYQFDATVLANSGTNNNNNIFLYKNGTQLYQGSTQTVPSGDCGLTISVLMELSATNYVEIYWQTNFGAGMTLGYGSTPYKTYFSGYLVSRS